MQLSAIIQAGSSSFSNDDEGIIQGRRTTKQETSQLIHDLGLFLNELEGTDYFAKVVVLNRALDAFILRERPMSRTEFDWETDRVLDLNARIEEVANCLPEISQEKTRQVGKTRTAPQGDF